MMLETHKKLHFIKGIITFQENLSLRKKYVILVRGLIFKRIKQLKNIQLFAVTTV